MVLIYTIAVTRLVSSVLRHEIMIGLMRSLSTCHLTFRLLSPKSPGVSGAFTTSLNGSRTLPVLARQSWVYRLLIFCNSASTAAVLLASARNIEC